MNDIEKKEWLLEMLEGKACSFSIAYIKKPNEDWQEITNQVETDRDEGFREKLHC